MTATTHRAITDLTARLVIGALVLGALILIGVGITADEPANRPLRGFAPVKGVVGEAAGVQTQQHHLSDGRIESLGEDPLWLHGHSNES